MPRASSKRGTRSRALALAGVLLACLPLPALADPAPFVAAEARELDPPRPVGVLVPQQRLASSIELGRIAFPTYGGGALGAILVASNNDVPQRLAEAAIARSEGWIAPLLSALGDFDVAELAGEATRSAVEQSAWLGASPPELFSIASDTSGGSPRPVIVSRSYSIGLFGYVPNMSTAVEAWSGDVNAMQRRFDDAHADAAERAQVQWRYQMSPDFSQVQVFADVSIRRRGVIEPSYAQQVISVVRLNRPGFVEEDNVARWSANDAALARRALEMAFARAGEVLPQVLALDEASHATAVDRRRESVTAAGYHGPVLVRDDKGPVFWAQDGDQRLAAFVAVQTISE